MFFLRFLEFVGRITVIPFVALYFINFFATAGRIFVLVLCIIFVLTICWFDLSDVCQQYVKAMRQIQQKVDNPTGRDLSALEIVLFNLWVYRSCSTSISNHARLRLAKQQVVRNARRDIEGVGVAMAEREDL
jgi:hypothetical protein